MAETTIEWADYTFNPWIGCEKISAGCKNCYASVDTYARVSASRGLPLWGPGSSRHKTGEANWKKVLTWNRKAKAAREIAENQEGTREHEKQPYHRPRVFVASLADWAEDRRDLDAWRGELFALVKRCTELDFLFLTKRIDKVRGLVPAKWLEPGGWPAHVWIGTSVENQEAANKRIPYLVRIPARVRFLSMEPLLGSVDLSQWIRDHHERNTLLARNGRWGTCVGCPQTASRKIPEACANSARYDHQLEDDRIHLTIVGGESGPNARPMHPEWVRSIRDQCVAAKVPFFFKQWGAYMPAIKEEYWSEYGFPDFMGQYGGKSARVLDGRTWDEMPVPT